MDDLQLDGRLTGYLALGALLVIAGVVTKNSGGELRVKRVLPYDIVGSLLFLAGWALIAWIAYEQQPSSRDKWVTLLAILAIVVAVFVMRNQMDKKKKVSMWAAALFALGWLVFGWMIGRKWGVLAALLVLLAMMYLLPKQRKLNVVDGPGMPLFVIGWVVLIYSANVAQLDSLF